MGWLESKPRLLQAFGWARINPKCGPLEMAAYSDNLVRLGGICSCERPIIEHINASVKHNRVQ